MSKLRRHGADYDAFRNVKLAWSLLSSFYMLVKTLKFLLTTALVSILLPLAPTSVAAQDTGALTALTLTGAKARIYRVYCAIPLSHDIKIKQGKAVVVASVQSDGELTTPLIFTADVVTVLPLCNIQFDTIYVEKFANIEQYDRFLGGLITSISDKAPGQ
jgi:hypothetical protein